MIKFEKKKKTRPPKSKAILLILKFTRNYNPGMKAYSINAICSANERKKTPKQETLAYRLLVQLLLKYTTIYHKNPYLRYPKGIINQVVLIYAGNLSLESASASSSICGVIFPLWIVEHAMGCGNTINKWSQMRKVPFRGIFPSLLDPHFSLPSKLIFGSSWDLRRIPAITFPSRGNLLNEISIDSF